MLSYCDIANLFRAEGRASSSPHRLPSGTSLCPVPGRPEPEACALLEDFYCVRSTSVQPRDRAEAEWPLFASSFASASLTSRRVINADPSLCGIAEPRSVSASLFTREGPPPGIQAEKEKAQRFPAPQRHHVETGRLHSPATATAPRVGLQAPSEPIPGSGGHDQPRVARYSNLHGYRKDNRGAGSPLDPVAGRSLPSASSRACVSCGRGYQASAWHLRPTSVTAAVSEVAGARGRERRYGWPVLEGSSSHRPKPPSSCLMSPSTMPPSPGRRRC